MIDAHVFPALARGQAEDHALGFRRKHRPLLGDEGAVARQEFASQHADVAECGAVKRIVGGEVEIRPRHPIEGDEAVVRGMVQLLREFPDEVLGTAVVAPPRDRDLSDLYPFRHRDVVLPQVTEDRDLVAAAEQRLGDPHHVALQPAVGEVFEDGEDDVHAWSSVSSARIAVKAASSILSASFLRDDARLVRPSPLGLRIIVAWFRCRIYAPSSRDSRKRIP